MSYETNTVSDEHLAQEAQAGSLSRFEELVHRYEVRIYRFVNDRCRNVSDAEEVTQDVFVAAYRAMDRFDPRRSFVTWLFTIARRKCIDYSRGRRFVADPELPEPMDVNDPGALLAQREAGDDLWRIARAAMSEIQYDALWLRCAEDMEVAEIARVMRRTRTHVKVLLFRARSKLERELRRQKLMTTRAESDTKPVVISASQVMRPVSGS